MATQSTRVIASLTIRRANKIEIEIAEKKMSLPTPIQTPVPIWQRTQTNTIGIIIRVCILYFYYMFTFEQMFFCHSWISLIWSNVSSPFVEAWFPYLYKYTNGMFNV